MHRLVRNIVFASELRCRAMQRINVDMTRICTMRRRLFSDDVHRRQQSALDYYKRKREDTLYYKLFGNNKSSNRNGIISMEERNVQIAWYAAAVVIGALAATYAAVPLYKVFCQTTGFGGTTQRFQINEAPPEEGSVAALFQAALDRVQLPAFFGNSGSSTRVHTWTDEDAAARLASLKPVKNADMVTIRFDTTVGDVLPWSFVPVQLDVKVVPGETALSFFRVTNHSDKAITGVATYNVHPPKVGLYFQKIQCFCFEEQRLLPGETVDMPVFFFIDPDFLKDPQVSYVRSVTLSYTFFQTDVDDDEDDEAGAKNVGASLEAAR
ncbi:hypothetical protein MPSEU_000736300 [Mayamaea pseudoterrestris]|nr:hypothetical protein MPSEU_000736300 [Mayamaea pseudoterrestris]